VGADEAPTVQFPAPRGVSPPGPPAGLPSVSPREWPARRGHRRALLAGGAATVVALAAGATAAYAYAGDVPRGTTVLGADLGGLDRAGAVRALRARLEARAAELRAPVTVRVGESTVRVSPVDVGLTVDVEATVAEAARGGPRLFGTRAVAPVAAVDPARLDRALRAAAGRVGTPMTRPVIVFKGTTPAATRPKPGTGLDPVRSAEALRAGWLDAGGPTGRPVSVPLVEIVPATTPADVDRLLAELAVPAVAAPVTVTTDRGDVTIPPAAIARSLVLAGDAAGRITPRVDAAKLRAALGGRLAKVEVKPREATVTLRGGEPRVVASSGGTRLDLAALGPALLAVLPKADGREVAGTLVVTPPKTSTDEMAALGIRQRVSTFTTRFTGGLSSARSQNIVQIAKEVDGAVVKPGQTFSLNGHTGERSYRQGYKDAPVIVGGKLVPGVGGGASQFTTTLFNATYYAGLEDVEHKPHSYWFSRYPPVIESTIFYPDLDFKFRNNTPYGVLLDTSWTNSTITVSVWSTKIYDSVTTTWSKRRDFSSPRTIYLKPGPSCIETDGIGGFAQDAWRVFRKDGRELRREKFSWRYAAEPRYICAAEPE
jgi:vancomycin resistance protein YoaR